MTSVRVDTPAPHVLRVCIDRPEKRNAIDHAVRQGLFDALSKAKHDPATRAIVLGGSGGNFSAGGDVATMQGLDDAGARARMQHIAALCLLVAASPLPVVTAAEGIVAGGAMGLALLGDHIVVGADTRILFPFLKLGLAPDWALLRSLPERVGIAQARRLLTSGASTTGAEAVRIGLCDELAEGDVMQAAVDRASALAALPLGAFARMKARLAERAPTLHEELRREEDDQAALLQGADFAEGHDAFLARRPPSFIR
jgi:2-(1,2-epoxy-1,2-dihydrophenyl)acetyl-CoA isomerase